MMKLCLAIFVLIPLIPAGMALAGPGGCADCGDEHVCHDCQEFYAEIARKVPEKGARVWGWVLGGLTAVAFTWILIRVVFGGNPRSNLRRRGRDRGVSRLSGPKADC